MFRNKKIKKTVCYWYESFIEYVPSDVKEKKKKPNFKVEPNSYGTDQIWKTLDGS